MLLVKFNTFTIIVSFSLILLFLLVAINAFLGVPRQAQLGHPGLLVQIPADSFIPFLRQPQNWTPTTNYFPNINLNSRPCTIILSFDLKEETIVAHREIVGTTTNLFREMQGAFGKRGFSDVCHSVIDVGQLRFSPFHGEYYEHSTL